MPAQWSSPVRYVECDQQGVVFNAHYLTWADEASNGWWAAMGLPWEELTERRIDPLVKASSLDWTSSARWGDTVTVDAETERTVAAAGYWAAEAGHRVVLVERLAALTGIALPDGRRPEP